MYTYATVYAKTVVLEKEILFLRFDSEVKNK